MSKRKIMTLILELVIVIWTAVSVIQMLTAGGDTALTDRESCFRYFTTDSNILSAVASLVCAITILIKRHSRTVAIFKFAATCSVTVTFMTVALFLGPLIGYGEMLSGPNFYLHLVGPLCAILTLCLGAEQRPLTIRESLWGMLPVTVYAVLYAVEVVALKNWPDFYGFAQYVPWWVSLIAMHIATLLIVLGLRFLRNKCARQQVRA